MPVSGLRQLVAGVGDEPTLAVGGVVEAREHGVHRPRQATDLVGGRRLRNPAVQILRADGFDLAPDRLHRSQRPADNDPRGRPDQDEQDREPDQEQSHETVDAVA